MFQRALPLANITLAGLAPAVINMLITSAWPMVTAIRNGSLLLALSFAPASNSAITTDGFAYSFRISASNPGVAATQAPALFRIFPSEHAHKPLLSALAPLMHSQPDSNPGIRSVKNPVVPHSARQVLPSAPRNSAPEQNPQCASFVPSGHSAR